MKSYKEEQNQRIQKVFDYLSAKGVSQKVLADDFDCDASVISRFKNNPPLCVPDDFLEVLHEKYNINPAYIRLESDSMLDVLGEKLESFNRFVDNWSVVLKKGNSKSPDKYLHFVMDKNFYDFLIDTNKLELLSEEGLLTDEAKEAIKKIHDLEPMPQEYVLLPVKRAYEVISDEIKNQEYIGEVMHNVTDFSSYIE